MLKLFILFLFLYSQCVAMSRKPVAFPPQALNAIIPAVEKCYPKTNASPDFLLVILYGKYITNQKFKDFLYCAWDEAGYLTDGRIDINKATKYFRHEPLVGNGLETCSKKAPRSPDLKEDLFNIFKCFQDNVPIQFVIKT